ncbi:MAG: LysM peptidoglycan-binding domain-containing protein, partial [Actinomycetota bacterium]|nr:LysM peptidoglycan-binding domain-containing protein [Actinomycetota bacterium]
MRATKPRASHRRPPRRHPLLTLAAVGSVALAGAASTRAHVVGAGETLSEIGADHGVTVSELAEANGIDDIDRIVAGESLTIPDPDGTRDEGDGGGGSGGGGGGKADDATGEASGGEASGGEAHEAHFHTVAAGDTLSGLARTYGVSVRDLAEANGIVDIHHIRIGDRLDVSGSVR